MADHAILEMYRKGIIRVSRIGDVLEQWTLPKHDWGDKTAWRLFNATTFVLGVKVMERPKLTSALHAILDSVCERTFH